MENVERYYWDRSSSDLCGRRKLLESTRWLVPVAQSTFMATTWLRFRFDLALQLYCYWHCALGYRQQSISLACSNSPCPFFHQRHFCAALVLPFLFGSRFKSCSFLTFSNSHSDVAASSDYFFSIHQSGDCTDSLSNLDFYCSSSQRQLRPK